MSCQQVPAAPAFNPYPRSVQVGEFDVATGGGIWVAIGGHEKVRKVLLAEGGHTPLRRRSFRTYAQP